MLVLDTARADAFEPYGARAGASPVVAELAAAGDHAPLAYAPSSWTVPTHAAMFAGELPRALGLGQAPGGTPAGVREVMRTLTPRLLPSVLRDAGYTTVGASCNSWISPSSGFDAGFDVFDHVQLPRAQGYDQPGVRGGLRWLWQGARAELDDGAEAVAGRVRAWFDGWDGTRPFFWFVNLVECHSPYLPPRPWNDLPLLGRLRAAQDVTRYQTLEAVWRHCATGQPVPAEALTRMRHLYGRAIASLDAWIGRLLELLASHRVLDDTIVVVTSDHGENFGEAGLIGHAFSLDDRLIRVPLVARGLDLPDAPYGLERLPASIADAIGLDAHPWEAPARAAAVAQFDPLIAPDAERLDELAARWDLDERARRLFCEPQTCATDGRRKLLRWGDQELAYDLESDPLEQHPVRLAGDDPAFAGLRATLARPEVRPGAARPIPRPDDDGAPGLGDDGTVGPDDAETRALEAQMRLLGYL